MRDDWRTDIENAPKDGSDVLFPIEFVGRAFWDAEMRRWVLAYPIHLDYVNAPSRFQLPKAQRANLSSVEDAKP